MRVVVVPALSDNYSYLIIDEKTGKAACVDPVEPEKVLKAAEKENVDIQCVLTTHNHWDHAGGNSSFKKLRPGAVVYGGQGDNAEAVEKEIGDGDEIAVGSVIVRGVYTPCHTPGHVCYYARDDNNEKSPGAVFTGDTMFVGGCGNFNSGTPAQMYTGVCMRIGVCGASQSPQSALIHPAALVEKICGLPDDTQVYVGHEYTVKNLQYALTVEPDNAQLKARLAWAESRRAAGEPTVPSSIADEKATNPFVRVNEKSVQGYAGVGSDPVKVIAEVRHRKDVWGRSGK